MPITDLLIRNAQQYGSEVALVEINPDVCEVRRRVSWREYELIEEGAAQTFRREITWRAFNEKANRCANLLLQRGDLGHTPLCPLDGAGQLVKPGRPLRRSCGQRVVFQQPVFL